MEENDDPQPAVGIPTSGARIRADHGLFDGQAVHDFAHSKVAKIGCAIFGLILLILVGSTAFSTIRSVIDARRAARLLSQADGEMDASNFPAAVASYNAALRERLSNRDRAYAYGNRGWALMQANRNAEAIPDFTAALRLIPNLAFAQLNRGLAHHRLRKFEEALADYDKSIAQNPNELDAFYNRSAIHAHAGRLENAISDMQEAIRCKPWSSQLCVAKGDLYLRQGDLNAAQASYEKAIRLDPEYTDAYWGLGKAFIRRDQPERGLAIVNQALEQHPKSAYLFSARGLIQMELRAPELARQDFDQAILHRPKLAMAYGNRAAVELWLGRPDPALAYAARAIALDPKPSFPHYIQGRALAAEREYDQAISAFDEAIARDANSVWAIVWRALTKSHAGGHEIARSDLEKATLDFPGAAEAHLIRAWFLATCPTAAFRDGPLAVREGTLAVELSPQDAFALDALATAYAEAGNFAEAVKLEKQALQKMRPSDPDRQRLQNRLDLFQRKKPYRDRIGL